MADQKSTLGLNLQNLKWWQAAILIVCLAFASAEGVQVNLNATLQAQVNDLQRQLSIPVNSSLSGLAKEASYMISMVDAYACMQNGTNGALDYYSTNVTKVETFANGNLTVQGGLIYLKEIVWNTSIVQSDNVFVVQQYNGTYRYFSTKGSFIIPVLQTAPSTTGWGAADAGLHVWFDVDSSTISFWDGVSVQTVSTSSGDGGSSWMTDVISGSTVLTSWNGSTWLVAPSSLANAYDGSESTATGTGNKTITSAGTVGYVYFDLKAVYSMFVDFKVGMWISAGGSGLVQARVYYSSDNSTWVAVSGCDEAQTSSGDTSEVVRFSQQTYVTARYVALRFYGTATNSTTCSVKIYEVHGYEIQAQPIPVDVAASSHGGWGGYIANIAGWKAYIEGVLDAEYAAGERAFRYWAKPDWLYSPSTKSFNTTICDDIVHYAYNKASPMTVIIDAEHNYPSSAYITSGNEAAWEADLKTIGLRYANYTNVILECVNEYTGTDQPALYNRAIAYLRSNGVTTPLLFNFWWNQPCVALTDSLNNYAVGRHFYASDTCGGASHSTPVDLTTIITQVYSGTSTVIGSMNNYFRSTNTYYINYAVNTLHIPNGFVVTECGPGAVTYLETPGPYGMAYMLQFMREAKAYNVTSIGYRVGNVGGEDQSGNFDTRANNDFNAGNNTVFPTGIW